jgi:hypothetical protein
MYSILRKGGLAGLLAIFVCGCVRVPRIAPTTALQPPLQSADPAMAARQWDPSVAIYASGGTWAYPNYINFAPDSKDPGLLGARETPYFIYNMVYMPFVAFTTQPTWKLVLYQPLTMEPTYTANPPLPPSTQPSPTY